MSIFSVLQKAELFLGCVCIALGFVIYAHILYTGIGPSVFEGIWCGFWVSIELVQIVMWYNVLQT